MVKIPETVQPRCGTRMTTTQAVSAEAIKITEIAAVVKKPNPFPCVKCNADIHTTQVQYNGYIFVTDTGSYWWMKKFEDGDEKLGPIQCCMCYWAAFECS